MVRVRTVVGHTPTAEVAVIGNDDRVWPRKERKRKKEFTFYSERLSSPHSIRKSCSTLLADWLLLAFFKKLSGLYPTKLYILLIRSL